MRASEIVGVEDEYVAYCFDEVVAFYGGYVQHELDQIDGKNAKDTTAKRQLLLKRLLDGGADAKYATPVATR